MNDIETIKFPQLIEELQKLTCSFMGHIICNHINGKHTNELT